ncbi:MAG: polysaccharide deacetylase family protein [Proteobacteria bacterium]|nr:polysaccharide deacetylase family protein [Pseudomonadota bacterium]MBU1639501.1 polysaccharide deacetylase family protein [Pseudomonadota bacterium]
MSAKNIAMKNCLSIDWEDWFHICEVDHLLPRREWNRYPSILEEATDKILALLKLRKIKATFFILGYCARRYPHLVARIALAGHEIAYHTDRHQLLYDHSAEDFQEDLEKGRTCLSEICGRQIKGFRAPQWSLNQKTPWAVDLLIKNGFSYDSSHAPMPIIGDPGFPEVAHRLKGDKEQGELWEFPPMVLNLAGLKVPAAGGWGLRTWPMALILRKVRSLNRQGSPATFFLHPVDFTNHSYDRALPLVKKAVLSYGLRTSVRSLELLMDHLEFTTIEDCLENLKS